MAYDKYESAANITFTILGIEVPIQSVDTTKDVEIEEIRGNNLKPIGYSITEIAFSGSVTFDGNGIVEDLDTDTSEEVSVENVEDLEDLFTDDNGIPIDGSTIQIQHDNDNRYTAYSDVMITSDGYETSSGEVSGLTFDWIASDRDKQAVDGDGE